jgi:cell division protease FtsH
VIRKKILCVVFVSLLTVTPQVSSVEINKDHVIGGGFAAGLLVNPWVAISLAFLCASYGKTDDGSRFSINNNHLIGAGTVAGAAGAIWAAPKCASLVKYLYYSWFAEKFEDYIVTEKSSLTTKIEDKSFDDFIAHDEVVNQAKNFVKLVKNYESCKKLGARKVNGLIIEGAKGSGKTLLAKIIASELPATSMIEISSKMFGKTDIPIPFEKELEAFFAAAKEEKAIIFFSDLEKILEKPNAQKIFEDQIRSLSDSNDVIVVGERHNKNFCFGSPFDGCNDNDLSDEIARLGIERIKIFSPNRDGRKKLLTHYLKEVPLEEGLELDNLIEKWSRELLYRNAEELKIFVEQAVFLAIQDESSVLRRKDFESAFLKACLGLRQIPITTPEELYSIAVHEAGHALADILSGNEVTRISVIPREFCAGVEFSLPPHEAFGLSKKSELLRHIIGGLGGYCAEKVVFGEVSMGPAADLQNINSLIYSMVNMHGMGSGDIEAATIYSVEAEQTKEKFDAEINALRQDCLRVTMTLLEQNKDILLKLAQKLLDNETLYQEDIYEITGTPHDEASQLLD